MRPPALKLPSAREIIERARMVNRKDDLTISGARNPPTNEGGDWTDTLGGLSATANFEPSEVPEQAALPLPQLASVNENAHQLSNCQPMLTLSMVPVLTYVPVQHFILPQQVWTSVQPTAQAAQPSTMLVSQPVQGM